MKFIILASLLLSFNAWAMPSVGDRTVLSGDLHIGGQSVGLELDRELISFNSSTDKFLERVITTIDGYGSGTEDNWLNRDKFMSDEEIANVLAYCAQNGGELVTLTVGAGTFETCKFIGSESTVWIGRVPFGIVKLEGIINGFQGIIDLELTNFAVGLN